MPDETAALRESSPALAGRATVFVSWSGDKSRLVAKALADWLPLVMQGLDTFMSDGIPAGVPGTAEIFRNLSTADFGIVCVDSGNQKAPWLNFEAGALGSHFGDRTRVVPYLLDITKNQLTWPLTWYQAVAADRDGTLDLLESINTGSSVGPLIRSDRLTLVFNKFWEDLETKLNEARKSSPPVPVNRSDQDILQEVLELVRGIDQRPTLSRRSRVYPRRSDIFIHPSSSVQQEVLSELPIVASIVEGVLGQDSVLQVSSGQTHTSFHLRQAPTTQQQAELRELALRFNERLRFAFPDGFWEAVPFEQP